MDLSYEIVKKYVNEKSTKTLIRNNSFGFIIWSNLVILPFILFGVLDRTMTLILVCANILTCVFALLAIIFSQFSRAYSILFFGLVSFGLSIVHLLLIIRLIYFELGYKSTFVIIFAICGYLLMLIGLIPFHYNALKNNKYYNSKNKNVGIFASLVPVAGLTGLAVGKSLKGINQTTAVFILAICFAFLVYAFIFGSHNIFKFLLIKKYCIEFD